MIDRRDFIKLSSQSLIGTALLNGCQDHNQQANSVCCPNLIILIADDLRWDCWGRFNPMIQTPHLNQLAKTGIVYLNNFVTTAICPTSRASIFTGMYARSHGIWDFETALSPSQWQTTYHYLLRQANYRVGFVGKWGLGGTLPQNNFDYWAGFSGQGKYYTPTRSEHLTSFLTSQAENFIRQQTTPFCLTFSYKAPHAEDDSAPYFIPDRQFAQQYQNLTIPRYGKVEDRKFLPDFLQHTEAQLRYQKYFATAEQYQTSIKNYYRLISGIDLSVGRLVTAIQEQNFSQDTYVIFTSDNGLFLGEKGLAGKWFGFEPAIRTPLMISAIAKPEFTAQTVVDMTLNIDLAPTILGLAQVNTAANLFHGRDLLQPKLLPRKWWFYEHLFQRPEINIPANVGIRSEQYKYLFFPQSNHEMLFDLTQDPQETLNLAPKTSYQQLVKQYRHLVTQSEQELD